VVILKRVGRTNFRITTLACHCFVQVPQLADGITHRFQPTGNLLGLGYDLDIRSTGLDVLF